MTGNRSEISALKELTKTINISAAGVRLKESDKEDLMKMNLAVKEAIMVLEGKKNGEDYESEGHFIRYFTKLLNYSGRKTKETSKVYPVASAVESLSGQFFPMERFDLNAAKESETTKVQAGVVIDACKEYMRSAGSSWTVSSKVIKALVHAMELELTDFMGKE